MARRATAIKSERTKSSNILLLDAGDSLFGDRITDENEGRVQVEAMNFLGYNAMAIGDRELSFGVGVLQARMAEMKFPLLSANVVISKTGKLVAKPYVIEKIDGRNVAIIGLTNTDAERVARNPKAGKEVTDIRVLDPLATAKEYVAKAKQETNVVIILSHLGSAMDMQIAQEVPGITAIIGGHTRELLIPAIDIKPEGTLLSQAGNLAEHLGVLTIHIDEKGKASLIRTEALVLTEAFADDAEMVGLLDKYRQPK